MLGLSLNILVDTKTFQSRIKTFWIFHLAYIFTRNIPYCGITNCLFCYK